MSVHVEEAEISDSMLITNVSQQHKSESSLQIKNKLDIWGNESLIPLS